MKQQRDLILEQFEGYGEEYLSAQAVLNAQIEAEEKRLSDAKISIKQEEYKQIDGLLTGISNLVSATGKDNITAAILVKGLSSAQAAINSYLAFTNALATVPFPANTIAAAGILASGLAQQVKIISTPIPSAETGGRFIVPDLSPRRVDGIGMRVNPGEEINVTPLGMAGGDSRFNFTFVFNEHVFAEIINKLARSGELSTLQLAGNL